MFKPILNHLKEQQELAEKVDVSKEELERLSQTNPDQAVCLYHRLMRQ